MCALQWSKHEKEILSSHGFSQNQLCLWKYPSMVKMAELTGHTSRVLHLAQVCILFPHTTFWILQHCYVQRSHAFVLGPWYMEMSGDYNKRLTRMSWFFQSPDGYTVASAAGDETLRFWQVFGTPETTKTTIKAKSKNMGSALNSLNRIRWDL